MIWCQTFPADDSNDDENENPENYDAWYNSNSENDEHFILSTVNSVAVNSVAGFSAEQKATELTVTWNSRKNTRKNPFFSFISFA